MQDLILKNGYLFDPPNGYTGQRGDVAIQDGRITGVGKTEEEASQTVDVTGLAVTPGLIDFHAHFTMAGRIRRWSFTGTSQMASQTQSMRAAQVTPI